ncbi:MAG: hypothetical protein ABI442_02545 [Gemmatimonadaceae bacterium]
MAAVRFRSVDEIKETLQNAKSRGRGCALLIGAGCSVKAGIPTANGFVDVIKAEYKLAYERAAEKSYPKCMAELLLSERRDLIGRYVDSARINWAHLCIALLMQEGYVDRVLTTNFDLLVVRACAALGIFPAIYDFATSQLLKRADIPEKAVFYLHGQRTGFVLMNTEEDMATHSRLLVPVFEDAGSGRAWIVAGYSGASDPVFEHLANVPRFDNGLFWVGYGNEEPANHVREKLLEQPKDAFYTKGYDADSFFISLTRALNIFPPDLIARPFTYLDRTLSSIANFVDPAQTSNADEDDVMRTPRSWITKAIEHYERPAWDIITEKATPLTERREQTSSLEVAAQYLLMQGRYEQILGYRSHYDSAPSEELADTLSMAYVMRGNQLLDSAKATTTEEAGVLFDRARAMYEEALAVKPARDEALHNWGNLLLDLAKTRPVKDSESLFKEAESKYVAALAIRPDRHEVLINWGNLLLDWAKRESGERAGELFAAAEAKYQAALDITPGMPDVLLNWGNLLLDRAKTRHGDEAERLFESAEEKFKLALQSRPGMPGALYQWGNTLLDWAKVTTGPASDRRFDVAVEKYEAALTAKPDLQEALNNWGNLLLDRAKRESGALADGYFAQAEAKYQAALDIKPDMYEALNNWGNALLDRAKTKTGEQADQLFDEAESRYRQAFDMRPDEYHVLDNWGNALSDRARRQTGDKADLYFAKAEDKYRNALRLRPAADDVTRNLKNLLIDWARTKTGAEAERLVALTNEIGGG